MKKISLWLVGLCLTVGVYAQDGSRVGIVKIQDVLNKSEYAKQMETQIRASFRADESEIEQLQKLIVGEREKLTTDTLMSPESYAYKDRVLQIERLNLKLRDKVETFTKQTRAQMATFWRGVYADFRAAIIKIAAGGQYDLILTAPDVELSNDANNQDVPEAVMNEIIQRRVQHVSPKIDITQQVIDTMNAINRGRGTPAK